MDDYKVESQSNRRRSSVIRVRDAIIEEIVMDRNAGYVTISYGDMGDFNMVHIKLVTLLVGRETIIQNQFEKELRLRDLKEGMIVDAAFSSDMTRSVPPQARAYKIVTVGEAKPSNVKTGRVLTVDVANSYFLTGRANDRSSQIRFNITDLTIILDQRGNRINLRDIRPGQTVRVEHANFMTMSIPPQTPAYRVQIL